MGPQTRSRVFMGGAGLRPTRCKLDALRARHKRGEMAEWSMAVVLKTTEPETVPGDRIPLSANTRSKFVDLAAGAWAG